MYALLEGRELDNPRAKREKSYACFLDDLQRCERLGLMFYNFQCVSMMIYTVDGPYICYLYIGKPRLDCRACDDR